MSRRCVIKLDSQLTNLAQRKLGGDFRSAENHPAVEAFVSFARDSYAAICYLILRPCFGLKHRNFSLVRFKEFRFHTQ